MSEYVADEDRARELEDRLEGAKEVLELRADAYQQINDTALDTEDEDNPQSAPRGEEMCRVDSALELVEQTQRQLNLTAKPSKAALVHIERKVNLIESVIKDTPADELLVQR